MRASVIVGNLFGLAGLIAAAYYFFRSATIPPKIHEIDDLRVAFEKLLRRRRWTATLMALIACLFLVGTNLVDGLAPPAIAAIWMLILVLVALLLILAYIDLRALTKIRNELHQRVDRRVRQVMDLCQGPENHADT